MLITSNEVILCCFTIYIYQRGFTTTVATYAYPPWCWIWRARYYIAQDVRPLVLVTASNESLHARKQLIDKMAIWWNGWSSALLAASMQPDHTARPWRVQKFQPSCATMEGAKFPAISRDHGGCKSSSHLAQPWRVQKFQYIFVRWSLPLLFYVFAEMGKWSNAKEVRARISERGLRKDPACSWMEIGNNVHTFTARDHSHRDAERIHLKLVFSAVCSTAQYSEFNCGRASIRFDQFIAAQDSDSVRSIGCQAALKGASRFIFRSGTARRGDHTGTQVQQRETTRDLSGEDGIICCVYSDRGTFETVLKIGKLVIWIYGTLKSKIKHTKGDPPLQRGTSVNRPGVLVVFVTD
jgi:hypothetical protein